MANAVYSALVPLAYAVVQVKIADALSVSTSTERVVVMS